MSRFKDYVLLTKLRLSALVIISALFGYLIALKGALVDWSVLVGLMVGGALVTMGANGMNQVLERVSDALMDRTRNRPIPAGRMGFREGWFVSMALGLLGFVVLWYTTHAVTAILSIASLLVYVLVYTPMKRMTSIAVFVGAFPGAVPPLLGWVAATGSISHEALVLFFLQFIWQFPHFWSIAWRLEEDYKKGGFYLLPFNGGRDRKNAFQILLYTFFLLPMSWLPYYFGYMTLLGGGLLFGLSVLFLWPSVVLYFSLKNSAATQLMFASFFYLPLLLIIYLLNGTY
jgi:protoheme IX farnesyltransferase